MKKLVVILMAFALVLAAATGSLAKAKKTGEVEKNVYTDSKFGFQITGLKNWKVKAPKEPSLVRVAMTQRNFKVSTIPGADKHTTSIPTVIILADTTSLTLEQFEESLIGRGKLLQNKEEFMLKLDLLPNSETLEVHDVTIDSMPARDYTLKQPYKKTGEDPRIRDPIYGSEVIIKDFVAGHVLFFKKGKTIYVVQSSCEREFFYPVISEFQKILASWKSLE
ncbi:MAG: hypothetical protein JSV10_00470 [Candidatus Zixiibacteriota bacterium]|nr:MAG: hypothetical protein JSV10_00470 [candidate division Zixibacteria bacterium]